MKYAAFFRNLNLGRPPAPTRDRFEAAFASAGEEPRSFLTNGTLVFGAGTRREAERVLRAACAELAGDGFHEPAFLRDVKQLAALVAEQPFAAVDRASVYEVCISFLPRDFELPAEPPMRNRKGDVEVVRYLPLEMLSLSRKLGASPGSPNAFAERTFSIQATTRAWNTVVRLVERFG